MVWSIVTQRNGLGTGLGTGLGEKSGPSPMVRPCEKVDDQAMTQTPQQDHVDQDRVHFEHLRNYTRLRRSITDRKFAGIAGGLGQHLNVDPTILRVVLVVLCFFGGAGFVLYGAAWLLVPEEGQDEGAVHTSDGTRNTLLIVAAGVAALLLIGDSWGGYEFPWPLAVLALIAFVVLRSRDQTRTSGAATGGVDSAVSDSEPPVPPWMPPSRPDLGPDRAQTPRPDRGPKLFWITLALVAVTLGSLGLFESAGLSVTDSAYPALALTVVGTMLVVGAWFGRAGGLILLGTLAAVALAITSTISPRFEGGERTIDVAPVAAASVQDSYYVPAGRINLDLSNVDDIAALDGRQIDLDANAGEIIVTVPEGVKVDVTADVSIAGEAVVLGREANGPNVHTEQVTPAEPGAPELELDIHLLLGSIEVRQS